MIWAGSVPPVGHLAQIVAIGFPTATGRPDYRAPACPQRGDKLGVRLLAAFVIGFVTLTLEIAYTRVFSFKLFYYYTYFVIGVALLGLGAASAVTALSRRLRAVEITRLVQWVAPAAALVGVAGYVVVARLPTDINQIWVGTAGEAVGQVLRLLVLSLSLTAVFFGVGLILAAWSSPRRATSAGSTSGI